MNAPLPKSVSATELSREQQDVWRVRAGGGGGGGGMLGGTRSMGVDNGTPICLAGAGGLRFSQNSISQFFRDDTLGPVFSVAQKFASELIAEVDSAFHRSPLFNAAVAAYRKSKAVRQADNPDLHRFLLRLRRYLQVQVGATKIEVKHDWKGTQFLWDPVKSVRGLELLKTVALDLAEPTDEGDAMSSDQYMEQDADPRSFFLGRPMPNLPAAQTLREHLLKKLLAAAGRTPGTTTSSSDVDHGGLRDLLEEHVDLYVPVKVHLHGINSRLVGDVDFQKTKFTSRTFGAGISMSLRTFGRDGREERRQEMQLPPNHLSPYMAKRDRRLLAQKDCAAGGSEGAAGAAGMCADAAGGSDPTLKESWLQSVDASEELFLRYAEMVAQLGLLYLSESGAFFQGSVSGDSDDGEDVDGDQHSSPDGASPSPQQAVASESGTQGPQLRRDVAERLREKAGMLAKKHAATRWLMRQMGGNERESQAEVEAEKLAIVASLLERDTNIWKLYSNNLFRKKRSSRPRGWGTSTLYEIMVPSWIRAHWDGLGKNSRADEDDGPGAEVNGASAVGGAGGARMDGARDGAPGQTESYRPLGTLLNWVDETLHGTFAALFGTDEKRTILGDVFSVEKDQADQAATPAGADTENEDDSPAGAASGVSFSSAFHLDTIVGSTPTEYVNLRNTLSSVLKDVIFVEAGSGRGAATGGDSNMVIRTLAQATAVVEKAVAAGGAEVDQEEGVADADAEMEVGTEVQRKKAQILAGWQTIYETRGSGVDAATKSIARGFGLLEASEAGEEEDATASYASRLHFWERFLRTSPVMESIFGYAWQKLMREKLQTPALVHMQDNAFWLLDKLGLEQEAAPSGAASGTTTKAFSTANVAPVLLWVHKVSTLVLGLLQAVKADLDAGATESRDVGTAAFWMRMKDRHAHQLAVLYKEVDLLYSANLSIARIPMLLQLLRKAINKLAGNPMSFQFAKFILPYVPAWTGAGAEKLAAWLDTLRRPLAEFIHGVTENHDLFQGNSVERWLHVDFETHPLSKQQEALLAKLGKSATFVLGPTVLSGTPENRERRELWQGTLRPWAEKVLRGKSPWGAWWQKTKGLAEYADGSYFGRFTEAGRRSAEFAARLQEIAEDREVLREGMTIGSKAMSGAQKNKFQDVLRKYGPGLDFASAAVPESPAVALAITTLKSKLVDLLWRDVARADELYDVLEGLWSETVRSFVTSSFLVEILARVSGSRKLRRLLAQCFGWELVKDRLDLDGLADFLARGGRWSEAEDHGRGTVASGESRNTAALLSVPQGSLVMVPPPQPANPGLAQQNELALQEAKLACTLQAGAIQNVPSMLRRSDGSLCSDEVSLPCFYLLASADDSPSYYTSAGSRSGLPAPSADSPSGQHAHPPHAMVPIRASFLTGARLVAGPQQSQTPLFRLHRRAGAFPACNRLQFLAKWLPEKLRRKARQFDDIATHASDLGRRVWEDVGENLFSQGEERAGRETSAQTRAGGRGGGTRRRQSQTEQDEDDPGGIFGNNGFWLDVAAKYSAEFRQHISGYNGARNSPKEKAAALVLQDEQDLLVVIMVVAVRCSVPIPMPLPFCDLSVSQIQKHWVFRNGPPGLLALVAPELVPSTKVIGACFCLRLHQGEVPVLPAGVRPEPFPVISRLRDHLQPMTWLLG
eukprot:g18104.t1